jgi:hypothetical protein
MHTPKRNQCRSIRSNACALLALALLLSGCVRVERNFGSSKTIHKQYPPGVWNEHWLVFRQRPSGNSAIFESDKLTLVFPDLSRRERNSFDGEDIAIQIAGEGNSETTRTCNRNGRITTFQARYRDGVSTITFCGREVKLAESGHKVILTNQTIDLATEGSTVTVAALKN